MFCSAMCSMQALRRLPGILWLLCPSHKWLLSCCGPSVGLTTAGSLIRKVIEVAIPCSQHKWGVVSNVLMLS